MNRKPLNKRSKRKQSEFAREKRWHKAVIEKAGGQCQNPACNTPFADKIGHHIWRKQAFPEWKFVLENGMCLCTVCHGLLHAHQFGENYCGIDRDALRQEFMNDVGTIVL